MAQFNSSYIEINKIYWVNKTKTWRIYYDSFKDYTKIQLKNNGLDLNQLFNNISTKFKAIDGSQLIELELFARTDEKTLSQDLKLTSGKTFDYYRYIEEPLEKTVFWQIRADFDQRLESKCLTFFSKAQEQWRNFQAQMEAINTKMNLDAVYRSTAFKFDI